VSFGPGILVTAAFIGPGTVTTASLAGANYGFVLLWALLFSVIATFVLQEMAARLGLVARQGLAQALRRSYAGSWLGTAVTLLVVAAIGFGNAAYETGNIAGAALGLQGVTGVGGPAWAVAVGLLSGALLASGRYRLIERALVALVLLMSALFLLTLFMVRPPLTEVAGGLLAPRIPAGGLLTVIALIGTTVVPYNLFLHASAVQEKWPAGRNLASALRESRRDAGLSIGLGGLITLAIMGTSATAFFGGDTPLSAANMAEQLEPLLGPAARYFFAAGLFAAGLSSAVTAPLAAAFAVSGALGWDGGLRATRFRLVWLAVLLTGTLLAAAGSRPLAAILFAQAVNGFLLPVCAIFLLLVMNRPAVLGEHTNRPLDNIAGALVVLVTLGLGALKLLQVFGLAS
jgi:manganese transport protein